MSGALVAVSRGRRWTEFAGWFAWCSIPTTMHSAGWGEPRQSAALTKLSGNVAYRLVPLTAMQ
jgi:hypothetical protein